MQKDVLICPASGKPFCRGCLGPVYLCDPAKNNLCRKTACGQLCHHTHRRECSVDGVAICPAPKMLELMNQ